MEKDTIAIDSWSSLRQFGINSLTGEGDRTSMRLLCDVNEAGRELLLDYLGLPPDTALHDNMNSQVDGQPAIGSVMLDRECFMRLGAFALFRAGALANIHAGTSQIIGVFSAERLAHWQEEVDKGTFTIRVDIHRNPMIGNTAPGYGTRNTHMMTGRTV